MADNTCRKSGGAPRGWYCTRLLGHPGPCAARPTRWKKLQLWFKGTPI